MARNGEGTTGVLDAPTSANGAAGAEDAATAETEVVADPKALVGIMVRVPQELHAQIYADAKTQDTSGPQLVQKMLADAYGYELPTPVRKARKKYETEEEKRQAQRDSQKASRDTARAVLRAVERGDIQVDLPTLLARLKAEEEEKAKAKAEAEAATAGAS
jgi:hypothetical protein